MRAILLPVVVMLGACANFDRADQVKDLRVLALTTEPAELLYSPLLVLGAPGGPPGVSALPAVDVRVNIIAADPRGGALTATLVLCAENADDATCEDVTDADRTALIDALPEEDRAAAADALGPHVLDGTVDDTSAAKVADGLHATISLPASLVKALLPVGVDGQPSLSLSSALPRFGALVENGTNVDGVTHERAFKRLPMTLDLGDPTLPAALSTPLLSAFGTNLCTTDDLQRPAIIGVADCYRAPIANQNPVLLGFVFNHELDDDGVFTDVDADGDGLLDVPPETAPVGRIRITPGTTIEIDPVFTAASFESFQGFRLDVQTGDSILENRLEDLAIEWFATSGDVGRATTSQEAGLLGGDGSGRLGTSFASSRDRKSGESDTVIVIVHDQRGGNAVGRVEVEY